MKTICMIGIWIGKLPNSFPLLLHSIYQNKTIDFYIITDQDFINTGDNVHIFHMTLGEIKTVFEKEAGFRIKLKFPYKLCDYKPIWRVLLPNVVKNYDFWGYFDFDVIFGDIRTFVTDEALERYDKLFDNGNFGLYRFNEEMNEFYKLSMQKDNPAYPYKRVFRTNWACYFDEYMGMSILGWMYKDVLRDQLTENIVQDFSWKRLDFASYITGKTFIFQWKEGRIFRYITNEYSEIIDTEQKPKELLLAHIQKRDMKIEVNTNNLGDVNEFWILPNCYSKERPVGPLYTDEMRVAYADKIKIYDQKKRIKTMQRCGFLSYIPHLLTSRKIKRFIRTKKKFF